MPVGEAKLPEGGPSDKGLPLDSGIPGTSTFNKPEEDIRKPRTDDENIYRVEDADDLLKDRSRIDTREDNAGHHDGIGAYGEGHWDSTSKPKYPYRDDRPNSHNARLQSIVARYRAEIAPELILRPGDRLKVAVKLSEITDGLSDKVQQGSRKCKVAVRRVDVKNLRWIFAVNCGNGLKVVKLQAARAPNVVKLGKMDLKLSCSCAYWQWQGPEYHAKTRGYLLGSPKGTATTPDIKDPLKTQLVCKHVASVLGFVRGWEIPKKG